MRMTVKASLAVAAFCGGVAFGTQDPWEAPADARAVKNPVASSDAVLVQGHELYKKNCLMCHGEAGKGDGPATKFVKPAPADISNAATQERMTDGEIFWKVTEGKKPMPNFGKKLSEEERWKIVLFVRTLKAK